MMVNLLARFVGRQISKILNFGDMMKYQTLEQQVERMYLESKKITKERFYIILSLLSFLTLNCFLMAIIILSDFDSYYLTLSIAQSLYLLFGLMCFLGGSILLILTIGYYLEERKNIKVW